MFNSATGRRRYTAGMGYNGSYPNDYETHYTLYAGVDPADPKRALIRKVVQVNENTYCYEEVRITPGEVKPTVHSLMYRIKDFDIKEQLTPEEIQIRGAFRPLPNVLGFSLFSKYTNMGNHFTITENTLNKKANYTWTEWF